MNIQISELQPIEIILFILICIVFVVVFIFTILTLVWVIELIMWYSIKDTKRKYIKRPQWCEWLNNPL